MKAKKFLLAAAFLSASGFGADAPEFFRKSVLDGLRWYFHWMMPVSTAAQISCQGARIGQEYFAHCSPGYVTLELDGIETAHLNLRLIGVTPDDYAKGLAWFQLTRNRQPIQQKFQFSFSPMRVTPYNLDAGTSGQWMQRTLNYMEDFRMHAEKEQGRITLLFPGVSRDDPFYHVYAVEEGRVTSIWEFAVVNGIVQEHTHWVYDVPHHSIPPVAQSYTDESTRWYSVIPARSR